MYTFSDIQERKQIIETTLKDLEHYKSSLDNDYTSEIERCERSIELNRNLISKYEKEHNEKIIRLNEEKKSIQNYIILSDENTEIIPLNINEIIPFKSYGIFINDITLNSIHTTLLNLLKVDPKDKIHFIWKYYYDFIRELLLFIYNNMSEIIHLNETEICNMELTKIERLKVENLINKTMKTTLKDNSERDKILKELMFDFKFLFYTLEYAFMKYSNKKSTKDYKKRIYFPTCDVLTTNDKIIYHICDIYGHIPEWQNYLDKNHMKDFDCYTWENINDTFMEKFNEYSIRQRMKDYIEKINALNIKINYTFKIVNNDIEMIRQHHISRRIPKEIVKSIENEKEVDVKQMDLENKVIKFINDHKETFIDGLSTTVSYEIFEKLYGKCPPKTFIALMLKYCNNIRLRKGGGIRERCYVLKD